MFSGTCPQYIISESLVQLLACMVGKSSHGQAVSVWARLCSDKRCFTGTGSNLDFGPLASSRSRSVNSF